MLIHNAVITTRLTTRKDEFFINLNTNNIMKHYDYDKAKSIIKENKSKGLVEASLGMKEDWYWTSETIWNNGKYARVLKESSDIAGIGGSIWATPVLELIYSDETKITLNCYK
jgi:hypothetical protein